MSSLRRIREWLADDALPLWLDQGCCPDSGGFLESLTLDGAPLPDDLRRVRVQFRQMYVFSHAYGLGFAPDGLECARRGFENVWTHAWARDRRPGWAHLIDASGGVIDPMRDSYDHAFALFGLGWYHRVSRDPRALLAIRQTIAFMESRMRAKNGGWIESDVGLTPRRQNPHMHTFEAALTLYETTGERAHLNRAGEQFALFANTFFDPQRLLLLEYFDEDWRPYDSAEGQRVEPGHMAEWIWLLREYQRLTNAPIDGYANALFERLQEIGFDEDGRFLVDELTVDGDVTQATRRLWPQTELVRAALAQYRATGAASARRLAERTIEGIFDEYLADCVSGGWRDKFDLNGECLSDRMPASSLYHLFGAFATALEVLGAERVALPERVLSDALTA